MKRTANCFKKYVQRLNPDTRNRFYFTAEASLEIPLAGRLKGTLYDDSAYQDHGYPYQPTGPGVAVKGHRIPVSYSFMIGFGVEFYRGRHNGGQKK